MAGMAAGRTSAPQRHLTIPVAIIATIAIMAMIEDLLSFFYLLNMVLADLEVRTVVAAHITVVATKTYIGLTIIITVAGCIGTAAVDSNLRGSNNLNLRHYNSIDTAIAIAIKSFIVVSYLDSNY